MHHDARIYIPCRMESSRFPGKPLARLGDDTLLDVVNRAAANCREAAGVPRVLTDSADIMAFCRDRMRCGATEAAGNGTERIANWLLTDPREEWPAWPEWVVDWQADEIELTAADVDQAIRLAQLSGADVVTLACPLEGDDHADPDVVKVVCDSRWRARHFTRAPVATDLAHVGLYVIRAGLLNAYRNCGATPLERAESLEQLRWCELDVSIYVWPLDRVVRSINTPADLERAQARLAD